MIGAIYVRRPNTAITHFEIVAVGVIVSVLYPTWQRHACLSLHFRRCQVENIPLVYMVNTEYHGFCYLMVLFGRLVPCVTDCANFGRELR